MAAAGLLGPNLVPISSTVLGDLTNEASLNNDTGSTASLPDASGGNLLKVTNKRAMAL